MNLNVENMYNLIVIPCDREFLLQDPNPNNVVAAATFYSESRGAIVCLVSARERTTNSFGLLLPGN